jgi:hypothetical protein
MSDSNIIMNIIIKNMKKEMNAFINDCPNKAKFIHVDINDKINECAQQMYNDYLISDNCDEDLKAIMNDKAENDWYREYLSELFEIDEDY